MEIDTTTNEADLGGIKKGDRASFTVYAYPDKTVWGSVHNIRINPTTVSGVVSYNVTIFFNNDDEKVLPGMTAIVKIYVSEKKGVLGVPNSALRFIPTGENKQILNNITKKLKVGDRASFTVYAYPDKTVWGSVHNIRINPTTVSGVVSYNVTIFFNNDDEKVLPGMTAIVKIYVSEKKGVLGVPNSALRFIPTGENKQILNNITKKLKVGDRASFTVYAYPDKTVWGSVHNIRINPTTVSGVVSYNVTIFFNNDDEKVLPGMTAIVKIYVSEKKGVLGVPNSALRFIPTGENKQILNNITKKLKVGDRASFTVYAYPDKTVWGSVHNIRINPTTVSGVVSYNVTIFFNNDDEKVLPGMTAIVKIYVSEKKGVLGVPNSALRFIPTGENKQILNNITKKLKVGDRASFTVYAYPDKTVWGSVHNIRINPTTVSGVVSYNVTIFFNNDDEKVLPGMTAIVKIYVSEKKGVLGVPNSALRFIPTGENKQILNNITKKLKVGDRASFTVYAYPDKTVWGSVHNIRINPTTVSGVVSYNVTIFFNNDDEKVLPGMTAIVKIYVSEKKGVLGVPNSALRFIPTGENKQILNNITKKLKVGDRASFTVYAYPDKTVWGSVHNIRINPTTVSGVVSYNVTIFFNNDDEKVLPGMTAIVKIYVSEKKGVLGVPNSALRFIPTGENKQILNNITKKLKVGDRASFTVYAYPDKTVWGSVHNIRINPTTVSGVVSYNVTIFFNNDDEKVLPGMTAIVKIYVSEKKGVLGVPNSALRFIPTGENKQILNNITKKLKVGDRASFTVYAYPDKTVWGSVHNIRINPTTVSGVVSYNVTIFFNNDDEKVLPGMTAIVKIYVSEKKGVLGVPNSALRFIPTGENKQILNNITKKLKVGDRASFTVYAYPDKTVWGSVHNIRINPTTVSGVVSYNVTIFFNNDDEKVLPGMTAIVKIYVSEKKGVLGVPNSALRFIPTGENKQILNNITKKLKVGEGVVWVLENGVPKPVIVKLGINNDEYTEVASKDIQSGTEVITGIQSSSKGAAAPGRRMFF